MSKNVISLSGFVIYAPPLPLTTPTRPAAFNCPNILRTITGFTFVLPAKKSLVILYSSLNVSMQANI